MFGYVLDKPLNKMHVDASGKGDPNTAIRHRVTSDRYLQEAEMNIFKKEMRSWAGAGISVIDLPHEDPLTVNVQISSSYSDDFVQYLVDTNDMAELVDIKFAEFPIPHWEAIFARRPEWQPGN